MKNTNSRFQGKGNLCVLNIRTQTEIETELLSAFSSSSSLFFFFFLFLFTPRTPPSHACAFTAVSLCAAHYKFKTNPTQLVHFRRAGKKSIHAQTPESYLTACRLHPNGHSENCAAKADISRHLQAVIAFGSKISRLFEVISLYKLFQSVLMGVIIARGNNSFNVQTNARLFQFDR